MSIIVHDLCVKSILYVRDYHSVNIGYVVPRKLNADCHSRSH